jgi:hypothetical protein
MGRKSLKLIPAKKRRQSYSLLDEFLKNEAQERAEVFKSDKIPGVVKYQNKIAFCEFGKKPKIVTEDELNIIKPAKSVLSLIYPTSEERGGATLDDELPEAVAQALFEDARRKHIRTRKKDLNGAKICEYCNYPGDVVIHPKMIEQHFQSEEHIRNKKMILKNKRKFSNEIKWIRHSFIDGKLHFFLISPKTWEKIGDLPIEDLPKYKIADLSKEDLIEYQKGLRKCQTCGTWFRGRIDAISCSDKCRVARSEKKIRELTGKRATPVTNLKK